MGGKTHGYFAGSDIEPGIVHSTACQKANATRTSLQFQPIKLKKIVFEFQNADALDQLGRQNHSPMIGIMGEHRITSERVDRRTEHWLKSKKGYKDQ